ncbi:hypothetical protein J1605_011648 [Eschrichtius robustus]|uniref:Uncharacterized protein n=1 Tax=Eschrichtius robustus TaxID=9764 RepID=A0AB34GLT6_ESCRO|nr:hypothetical protein J1605_011648 [Eschrichtius robustus]
MGNCCWTQCFGLLRKEAGRLQRGGGGGGGGEILAGRAITRGKSDGRHHL